MAKIPLDDSPPPDEIEKVLFVSSNPTEGKETFGGYDPNYFIDKFTEMELELISCVVCKGIIREACSTDENHVCVVCLQGLASFKPMTSVRNTVSKRNIKCPLLRDCEWIGKIHEAEIHLKQCGSFRITCSLECGSVMKRCELESHTNTTCPLREVQCRNCNIIVLAKELKDHLTTCLKLPIRCKCEKEIPRDAMDMHVETDCPLAEVECPYAKYSCKIGSVLRKDMLAHKNKFYIEHQDMLEERHIKLENEHKKLENEHIKLKVECKDLKDNIKIKKNLNGVELKINLIDGRRRMGREAYLEIGSYAFNCYVTAVDPVRITVKRIPTRTGNDRNIVRLTESRIILIPRERSVESYLQVDTLNIEVKVGESKAVCRLDRNIYDRYLQQDGSLLVGMYLDLDYVAYTYF